MNFVWCYIAELMSFQTVQTAVFTDITISALVLIVLSPIFVPPFSKGRAALGYVLMDS